jgi:hypothetical protein
MWQELADIPPTLIKEKDPEGLLTLRAKLLASLGPQFLWIIFLSTDEWPSLTTKAKQRHTTMHMAFIVTHIYDRVCTRLWKHFAALTLEDVQGRDSTFWPSP